MTAAVSLKFTKNPILLQQLQAAQGKFVEANLYDQTWGVGIALKDDQIFDQASWKGKNWLGDILTDLKARDTPKVSLVQPQP